MTLNTLFTNIANAIRSKTGSTAKITASDFPAAISNIKSVSSLKTVTLTSSTKTFGYGDNTFTLDFSSSLSYLVGITAISTSNPRDPRARSITVSINNSSRTITFNFYKTNSDSEANNTVTITAIGYWKPIN